MEMQVTAQESVPTCTGDKMYRDPIQKYPMEVNTARRIPPRRATSETESEDLTGSAETELSKQYSSGKEGHRKRVSDAKECPRLRTTNTTK